MARVVIGCVLVAVFLVAFGGWLLEVSAAEAGQDQSEAAGGVAILAAILLCPGAVLVHRGARGRARIIFLIPAMVFATTYWVVVRPAFAGSDTWNTPLLVLFNLVLGGLVVVFLALGLYPVVRRLRPLDPDPYSRLVIAGGAFLIVGMTTAEVVVNNRHRDSLAGRLQSENPAVRIAAAKELAETGYTGALSQLAAALQDPEAEVRMWVAQALGESESRDAAAPLAAALSDADAGVRLAALRAIENLRDKRNEPPPIPALTQLIEHADDEESRIAAARLMTGYPAAEETLLVALRRADLAVVAGAYSFFVGRGEKGSERVLIEALDWHGTKEMAEDLLNCGNPVLSDAATRWAERRGYEIRSRTGNHGSPHWGERAR